MTDYDPKKTIDHEGTAEAGDTPAAEPAGSAAPDPSAQSGTPDVPGGGSGGSGGAGSGGFGTGGGTGGYGGGTDPQETHDQDNIWIRLLFMVGYGFLAWFVFGLTIFLAILQFIVMILNRELNEDLRKFSRNVVLYLADLLSYITFLKDDKPFPLGPFPKD